MNNDEVVSRLGEAAINIASGLELADILQHVVDAAASLLDARYAALGVVGDADRLVEFVHTGFDGDAERIGHLPEGRGILGLLIRDARPLRLTDLTTHPESVGFPPGHPTMRSFVGVPIRVRERVFGNLYVTEKRAGAEFTAVEEELALTLAAIAGAAVANASLYGETRRRERSLDAVREISGEILSGTDGSGVLQLIAERASELMGGALAVICVPRPGHEQADLVIHAAAGGRASALLGTVVPGAASTAGEVMRTARLVVTDRAPSELAGVMGDQPAAAAVGVPLLVRGTPFGALILAAPTLGDDDLRLAETFANHASVMVEYSRARTELERLMLIEERERIGRDLHDSVIQRLFATGLQLQALASRLARRDPEVAGALGDAVDALDDTIAQIRATIFALQPPEMSSDTAEVTAERIHELVAGVIAESSRALGFEPALLVPNDPDVMVPRDVAAHLLVVVREGLSNVARHASATEVVVEVELGDECIARVTDDGIGLPPEVPAGGRGLSNMRHRAAAVGGDFAVNERREGGTILEWRVRAVRA